MKIYTWLSCLVLAVMISANSVSASPAIATLAQQKKIQQIKNIKQVSKKGLQTVYLHIDYMVKPGKAGHHHRPSQRSIKLVKEAFLKQGILLDVDSKMRAIPEVSVITEGSTAPGCGGAAEISLERLRETYSPRVSNEHYVVFGHNSGCNHLSGVSQFMGYSFVVSLGAWSDSGNEVSDEMIAGTLMHELGHNFGLLHGGAFDLDKNPAYHSVMNHSYQFGIPVAATAGSLDVDHVRIDYSNHKRDLWDGMNERLGHGFDEPNNLDLMTYYCYELSTGSLLTRQMSFQQSSIDFNCDGRIEGGMDQTYGEMFDIYTGACSWAGSIDTNHDGVFEYEGASLTELNNDGQCSELPGFDDWTYVKSFLENEGK